MFVVLVVLLVAIAAVVAEVFVTRPVQTGPIRQRRIR